MFHPPSSTVFRLATIAATLAGAAALLLGVYGQPAQAQGPMSAPACQCSAPTPIPGLTSRIAHCMCGVLSCAIAEPEQGTRSSQMQCVRQ
ncbi:hypothetical protein O4H66_13495 [Comamonadaceae bacterium G21597-S1]|nr:hypothetical protein [Comamonadaceae bacterium G21597-S1]